MNFSLLPDGERFAIHHGDCIPHLFAMPPASIDFSVFSVPFPSVYSYTSLPEDIGNSEELDGEAKFHFSCFFRALRPVIKPGRIVACHCTEIVRMKRTGHEGMYPFPDLLRRIARRAGFTYQYTWQVRKNPQAQAIRTKSRQLQFAGLESDRANCRGTMADYVIILKAPGENAVPVRGENQVTRGDWINWAEASWSDIRETDTLNVKEGRGDDDTKHICPLQLGTIERLIRLYTNPGEIVNDPFTGIGSTGHEALRLGRRFYGEEIKDEYHAAAIANCRRGIELFDEAGRGLFDLTPAA